MSEFSCLQCFAITIFSLEMLFTVAATPLMIKYMKMICKYKNIEKHGAAAAEYVVRER